MELRTEVKYVCQFVLPPIETHSGELDRTLTHILAASNCIEDWTNLSNQLKLMHIRYASVLHTIRIHTQPYHIDKIPELFMNNLFFIYNQMF
jgi:hypothetical protein